MRKFITKVESETKERTKTEEDLKNRVPIATIENGKVTYKHSKDKLVVAKNDKVTYTLRVYNEGDIAGFAKKVRDTIPEGLTFLPEDEINKEYGWYFIDEHGNKTEKAEDAKYIETEYLSRDAAIKRESEGKTPGKDDTILLPLDKEKNNIHARDLKVVFKVNENAKPRSK